ncbi:DNA-dependent protein kinase catalytic subunit-like [Megalopta genalis]|uniref:DNA-dependent protein kinase catalytic subunit-like n=1 Tax=Megalopta genalis TaxID=115081 RepID=UPI003FD105C8
MPQYHAKIMKLESSEKVLKSLRKPTQIVMISNDAKECSFLVKFGEDLRQEQRLQQLFTVMNKTLRIHAICNQRHVSGDFFVQGSGANTMDRQYKISARVYIHYIIRGRRKTVQGDRCTL